MVGEVEESGSTGWRHYMYKPGCQDCTSKGGDGGGGQSGVKHLLLTDEKHRYVAKTVETRAQEFPLARGRCC